MTTRERLATLDAVDMEDCKMLTNIGWYETEVGQMVQDACIKHDEKHDGDFLDCPKLVCQLARQAERDAVSALNPAAYEVRAAAATCPLCGGAAGIFEVPYSGGELYRVVCGECSLTTDSYATANIAEAAWNERKGSEAAQTVAAALNAPPAPDELIDACLAWAHAWEAWLEHRYPTNLVGSEALRNLDGASRRLHAAIEARKDNAAAPDLTATLERIVALVNKWEANGLGGVAVQRKRWQKLGEIARAALTKDGTP